MHMTLNTPALRRITSAATFAAALMTMAMTASSASETQSQRPSHSYTTILFGYTPYNMLGRAQYPALLANFNTLKNPLVFLPGDNDWTDCWGRYGPSRPTSTSTTNSI